MRALRIEPGDTVLDAGCGAGVHSARVPKAGHTLKAVDISAAAIADAANRAARTGLAARIGSERADVTALRFPDASFARIFSQGVIIRIPDALAAVDGLARVLQPSARMVLHVTYAESLEERLKRWL